MSNNTRTDYINFDSDVAKLRHIEFESKKPEHVEINLVRSSNVKQPCFVTKIPTSVTIPDIKKIQSQIETKIGIIPNLKFGLKKEEWKKRKLERDQKIRIFKQKVDKLPCGDPEKCTIKRWIDKTKAYYKLETYQKYLERIQQPAFWEEETEQARSKAEAEAKTGGITRDSVFWPKGFNGNEIRQIPYGDKNYWIHPDERSHSGKKFVVKRVSRRIRECIEYKPHDTVAYVKDREDHHCHRYDSHKEAFECCNISKGALSAQFDCTEELPHVHYTHFERIVHPGKTVHDYKDELGTIIETRDINQEDEL